MAIVAVAAGFAIRGVVVRSLSLGDVRLRFETLFAGAFAASVGLPLFASLVPIGSDLAFSCWLALMFLLLGLSLLNVGSVRGLALVSAGVALNTLVIAANHGMPVLPSAVWAAGGNSAAVALIGRDTFHVVATQSTKLILLADILPLPGPQFVHSVLSVGDVLMSVGVAVVIAALPARPPGAKAKCGGAIAESS